MDTNIISKDKVMNDLKNIIIETNNILNRWIDNNGISANKINNDEVRAIFLGKLRKTISHYHNWTVFKRISKVIKLSTVKIDKNLFIEGISYVENPTNSFYNQQYVGILFNCIDEIDCKELQIVKKTQENLNINTYINFDLKELEKITF